MPPINQAPPTTHEALGEFRETFAMSVVVRILLWVLGVVTLPIGVAIPVLFKLRPPAGAGLEFWNVLLIGGAFFFCGLTLIAVVIYYGKLRYHLHEQGIVQYDRGHRDAIAFADIVKYRDTLDGIEFGLADGRSVYWNLGQTRNPFQFRDIIRAEVCTCLWPVVQKRFKKGETIEFDDLKMSRDKIVYKGKELRWTEVSEVFVVIYHGTRTLYIKQAGALFTYCKVSMGPRGGIPNHFLIEKIFALTRPDLLIGESTSPQPD